MKMLMLLITLITLSFADIEKQKKNADLISSMVSISPLKHARNYEKTLIMISLQESDLGLNVVGDKNLGNKLSQRSLGLFHMRIVTVRELQRYFPKQLGFLKNMTNKQIANQILDNKVFGIFLALYNIERVAQKAGGNYVKLVSQWNGGFHNMPYYNAVLKHKKTAESLIGANS